MADTLQLEIVTPDRQVVNDRAEEVQIPSKRGYLGVLPGHAPTITELDVGEIVYRTAGRTERIAVAWGFAEILPNKVTILAESAERPQDIDIARATNAKVYGEQLLTEADTPEEVDRAMSHIRRAENRLTVAKTRA